ncbi:hypothetical protein CsSME_00045308 [Camellia sinensis var. sinensis]
MKFYSFLSLLPYLATTHSSLAPSAIFTFNSNANGNPKKMIIVKRLRFICGLVTVSMDIRRSSTAADRTPPHLQHQPIELLPSLFPLICTKKVELVKTRLRKATERYSGPLSSTILSRALSQPLEKEIDLQPLSRKVMGSLYVENIGNIDHEVQMKVGSAPKGNGSQDQVTHLHHLRSVNKIILMRPEIIKSIKSLILL